MKKIFLFCFLLLFSKVSFSNEIVDIKTYDRDSYIRIMFEMKEHPKYFVTEEENNRVDIRLPKAKINSPLHKEINKLNVIDGMFLFVEDDVLRFRVVLKDGSKLMRYLYTEPASNTPYYRVIVDINKPTALNSFLENNLYEKNNNDKKTPVNITQNTTKNATKNMIQNASLDDLIAKNVNNNVNFLSVDELIKENVKADTLDELLDLNNINEEEVTRSFEEQNNEKIDMNDFLKTISVKVDEKPKPKPQEIKKYIVVLDAGHGGKDPGAIGIKRTKEKDVNLAFALHIKKELEKSDKIKVYLTRSNDTFISLSDRVNKSRRWHADLFISIHSDSNENKNVRGLSIYTLSKSASDTRTAELLRQTAGSRFAYWRNKTKYDNMRYKALNESVKFSKNLINNLKRNRVRMFGTQPLKQANFAVLLAPEYPSLLIELGFISNAQDERLLKTMDYRKLVARNIVKSVNEYFRIR